MPAMLRSGSELMTWLDSYSLPPAMTLVTVPFSTWIFSTGVFMWISPPSRLMSSVMVSHIWPGP